MSDATSSFWLRLILIFIIFSKFSSADQKTMTVASGQNVTLPCQAPNNFTFISVVKWRRADLGTEYVLVYRDGHFDRYKKHPSFKNWVDLQDRDVKDGDVSVILKDVTADDTGTYECYIFSEETSSLELIGSIYLSVSPPGQPGGLNEDGSVRLRVCLHLPIFIVASVVLLIYIKHKKKRLRSSYSLV